MERSTLRHAVRRGRDGAESGVRCGTRPAVRLRTRPRRDHSSAAAASASSTRPPRMMPTMAPT
jgi:hypothetical protein